MMKGGVRIERMRGGRRSAALYRALALAPALACAAPARSGPWWKSATCAAVAACRKRPSTPKIWLSSEKTVATCGRSCGCARSAALGTARRSQRSHRRAARPALA